jgi:hypothetical protein
MNRKHVKVNWWFHILLLVLLDWIVIILFVIVSVHVHILDIFNRLITIVECFQQWISMVNWFERYFVFFFLFLIIVIELVIPELVFIIDMIRCYSLLIMTVNLHFPVTGNLQVVWNHRWLVWENSFRKIQVYFWNDLLLMKYTFAVYVRWFEQRSNETEYSKWIKAALPILKGEQVCFEIFKILNIQGVFFC